MRVRLVTTFVAIASLLLAPCAYARGQAWPTTGGWDIAELRDACGMVMEYEGAGDTRLVLLKYADGKTGLVVSNYGWSSVETQKYDLTLYLDGESYRAQGVGVEPRGGRRGLAIAFGADFIQDFAKASSLRIYLGDSLVDQLSLKGSSAALAVLERCVGKVSSRIAAEAREKARLAHIPRDPFAGERSAPPRGNPASWVTNDDYPPTARRAGEEGSVDVEVAIDATGRISACKVVKSSGSSVLDAATCSLVQRRGRYQPATDSSGSPTTATATLTYRWSLSD